MDFFWGRFCPFASYHVLTLFVIGGFFFECNFIIYLAGKMKKLSSYRGAPSSDNNTPHLSRPCY
ncbi:hypothetical protein CW304_09515 [Bacillus sp. UFRGS-B20]|nr:hypothetical protein CW304_09515 [Bacillus sp. UFRGS-B20]